MHTAAAAAAASAPAASVDGSDATPAAAVPADAAPFATAAFDLLPVAVAAAKAHRTSRIGPLSFIRDLLIEEAALLRSAILRIPEFQRISHFTGAANPMHFSRDSIKTRYRAINIRMTKN